MIRDARALARAQGAVFIDMDLMLVEARILERAGRVDDAKRIGEAIAEQGERVGSRHYLGQGARLAQREAADAVGGSRGLTLDAHRSVHLRDGRRVSLAQNELGFRVLGTLIDNGGSATKEQLAREVWGRRTYSPSRDDKRMQMAVRRLRVLLEIEPSRPQLLVTTPLGYALGS